MPSKINLIGRLFGRLKVVRAEIKSLRPKGINKVRWICLCQCGTTVTVSANALMTATTKSCGCLARELLVKRNTKHGRTFTREWTAWSNAKRRCYTPKTTNYHNYGGRGITMCDLWRESFSVFYADMGPCPPDMTLDRKDTNGNYEPGNCRWATRTQQARNRRDNRMVELGGRQYTIAEASEVFGIQRDKFTYRLSKRFAIDIALNDVVDLRAGRKFSKPVTSRTAQVPFGYPEGALEALAVKESTSVKIVLRLRTDPDVQP